MMCVCGAPKKLLKTEGIKGLERRFSVMRKEDGGNPEASKGEASVYKRGCGLDVVGGHVVVAYTVRGGGNEGHGN